MIKATPAPKVTDPYLLFVPYAYAFVLATSAIVQLMGIGGFDFAHIRYQTAGLPGVIVTIAALEIFALPFLLRLPLSALARLFSAAFALFAPLFIVAHMVYLMVENIQPTNWLAISASVIIVLVGAISFVILDGPRALKPKK